MSIVLCPEPFALDNSTTCAVCGKKRLLRAMSVGRLGLDGRRAFICSEHLDDPRHLVEGWANFLVGQQQRDAAGLLKQVPLVVEQGMFVEHCTAIPERRPPSQHVARHLYARYAEGPALVITDQPRIYLSAVMKKWRRLVWRTRQEQSSTLVRLRILVLAKQCSGMERTSMRMFSQPLDDTDVYFALPKEVSVLDDITQFQTIYVISKLGEAEISKLAATMSAGAVLVRYSEN